MRNASISKNNAIFELYDPKMVALPICMLFRPCLECITRCSTCLQIILSVFSLPVESRVLS